MSVSQARSIEGRRGGCGRADSAKASKGEGRPPPRPALGEALQPRATCWPAHPRGETEGKENMDTYREAAHYSSSRVPNDTESSLPTCRRPFCSSKVEQLASHARKTSPFALLRSPSVPRFLTNDAHGPSLPLLSLPRLLCVTAPSRSRESFGTGEEAHDSLVVSAMRLAPPSTRPVNEFSPRSVPGVQIASRWSEQNRPSGLA